MKSFAASLLCVMIVSNAQARVWNPDAVTCNNLSAKQSTDAVVMINFYETLTSPEEAQLVFDKKRSDIEAVIAKHHINPTYIQVIDNQVGKPLPVDLHIMTDSEQKRRQIENSFGALLKNQETYVLYGGIEVHVSKETEAAILLEDLNSQGITFSSRVNINPINNCAL